MSEGDVKNQTIKTIQEFWAKQGSTREIDLPRDLTGERVYIKIEEDGTHSLVAENDCGFNCTSVPLEKLIAWLKVNMPQMLE